MKDLRTPIGLFFIVLGILLMTVAQSRAQIDVGPVNLYSGIAIALFGVLMFVLGKRAGTR